MIRKITGFSLLATAVLGMLPVGCKSGGVGDPCVPEDEYQEIFPGYQVGESNAETKSFQCETRLCLVDHFQGRVSCKYGQPAPALVLDGAGNPVLVDGKTQLSPTQPVPVNCSAPDSTDRKVRVAVDPQLVNRTADKAVYCSCRCDGKDKNARYCKCPSGFSCQDAIPDTTIAQPELVGSYCIKDGAGFKGKDDADKLGECSATGADAKTRCESADQG